MTWLEMLFLMAIYALTDIAIAAIWRLPLLRRVAALEERLRGLGGDEDRDEPAGES